jgi:VanZ family protein
MERDTRRLAMVSVTLGICAATLMPVQAGLADALRHGGPPWRSIAHASQVFSLFDAGQNILLFFPLGFLLGSHAGLSRGRSPKQAACLCLLLSAAIEFAQAWIPGRFPSLSDVTFNALGGGLGAWAALRSRSNAERIKSLASVG